MFELIFSIVFIIWGIAWIFWAKPYAKRMRRIYRRFGIHLSENTWMLILQVISVCMILAGFIMLLPILLS